MLAIDWGPRVRRRLGSPANDALAETGYGLKHRMHPFAAVLGLHGLGCLDSLNARRSRLLTQLAAKVIDVPGVVPPPIRPDEARAWYRFVIRLAGGRRAETERVVELLRAEGLQARASATVPVHTHAIADLVPEWRFGAMSDARVDGPGEDTEAQRFADAAIELPPFSEARHEELIPAYAEGIRKVWRATAGE